jgi:hypothetical protein
MSARPVLMSPFTMALLLPVMYRRLRRRTGAPAAVYTSRKGRLLIAAMAMVVALAVAGGAAIASNSDPDGSKTGATPPA